MLAAAYDVHGHPSKVVSVKEIPKPPSPGPGDLLIKVSYSSLNPADFKSGLGEQAALLSFQWPRTYGFDFSGEVIEAGPATNPSHAVGSQVFGMIQGLPQLHRGTLSEYITCPSSVCAIRPVNVTHKDAAAVPLVAITAVKMLEATNVKEGAKVLVLGGAGGVGSIAIQLAKKMFKCGELTTTASAGLKTEAVKSFGADAVVDYRSQKFEEVLPHNSFDVVLDCMGEAWRAVPLLKEGGGMCSIQAGPTASCLRTWMEEAKLDPRTVTTGVRPFLFSTVGGGLFNIFSGGRSLKSACEARGATFAHIIGTGNGEIMSRVASLLAAGEIKAVIDSEFTLQDSVKAIEKLMAGRALGKIVIKIEA
ncbi:hypothetical protein TrVE_jg14229 [Triparma verrucosa]|uniref:Enoyl reductase (ER) domain-containing protein n=1 Tax=Triparma verrucosa TaxID=1606542 RepID=A0A9W7BED2_9STRA|nr:hypothetical protein TrVE_jg14229 [Triparma verrucosa]